VERPAALLSHGGLHGKCKWPLFCAGVDHRILSRDKSHQHILHTKDELMPEKAVYYLWSFGGWLLVEVGLKVAGPGQHAIIQVTLTRVPSSSHTGRSTLCTGLPNALAQHLISVL
jgi:hypothetical protein